MSTEAVESALRRRGEAIARMEPGRGEVRAALAWADRSRRRSRTPRRGAATLATGLACLLLGGAVATAATGVLDPALDVFFGGGEPPGRSLPASEVPEWLRPEPGFNAPEQVSVIASDGPEHLYAYRQRGSICFDYGHHVGECRSPAEWRHELEAEPWILRGPVGRSTWFGLVDASVATVRVEYGNGGAAEAPVGEGGFVLDVDPAREPQRLVAVDVSGEVVATRPLGAAGGP